ncbi:MAG: response regulator [Planctomycetota bacterium]|nr:response regulator [Planctomycetota bacterium]
MTDKTILLVEDNPDDELLTLRALSKSKVTNKVVVVRDGQEALDYLFHQGEYAQSEHALPTLILLDLHLPRIDGHEVLRRIRADPRTRLVSVVILTSSKEQEDLQLGYDQGANSYIQKPVNFSEFVQAVGHLQVYWMVLNEPPPRTPPGA